MLSAKKNLEIANVCYANVSSNFAIFCNPKFRGPNFAWSKFSDMMAGMAEGWVFIHDIKGPRQQIVELAEQYAREIADRMLDHSGFLEQP